MTLSGLQCNGLTREWTESLNPSFSGWPSLGMKKMYVAFSHQLVLIPLLVDDPLWDVWVETYGFARASLNPSFSGWPSLGIINNKTKNKRYESLNPSFSGWPSLGELIDLEITRMFCLNPSFSGWPSLGITKEVVTSYNTFVLIPLLVDDPLWASLDGEH